VAHILRHTEFGCNAFLGGTSGNYNTNFWSSANNVSVVEADEYDRSFLKLSPDVSIISSMDPDHLDIYGTAENMEEAFIDFSARLKPGGLLISRHGLKRSKDLVAAQHISYDVNNEAAGITATNIRMDNGSYLFDVILKSGGQINWSLPDVVLNMGGLHNIENAIAAIMVAHHLKISDASIKDAVSAFKGVKRRFEYVLNTRDHVLIDDYAHHPAELKALITGARGLFPGRKCTVIFQPHLFSRTRDFAAGFAEVLDLADEVILLPIYPARELPMEGVTSDIILQKMKNSNRVVMDKQSMLSHLAEHRQDLLITAGAGDIDALVNPIKEIIERTTTAL
jgi:UDP-N-acetylmuramate--alanine ligase